MNKKQIQFVNEYFVNGMNATQAYRKIYPNSSYETACVNASKLLTNTNIQNLIQVKFEDLQIKSNTTILDITNKVKNIIDECQRDNDRTNLLKALDLLARMLGAYHKKRERKPEITPLQINIIVPSSNPDRVKS